MSVGTQAPEFWLDMRLDRTEFILAFEESFPGCEAEHVEVVPDRKFYHFLFHLHVPPARETELALFLKQYLEKHGPLP